MIQDAARMAARAAGEMSLALARGSGRRRDLVRWAASLRAAADILDSAARRRARPNDAGA